jgi:hypothetical protein
MIIKKDTLEECLNDYIKRKGYVVVSFDILPDYNEGEGGILVTYRSRVIIDGLEGSWFSNPLIIVIPLEYYLPYHRDQNLDDLLDVE